MLLAVSVVGERGNERKEGERTKERGEVAFLGGALVYLPTTTHGNFWM